MQLRSFRCFIVGWVPILIVIWVFTFFCAKHPIPSLVHVMIVSIVFTVMLFIFGWSEFSKTKIGGLK